MKEHLQKLGTLISKNSPTILTGMAVAGLVSTAVLAVRVTPKALRLIDMEREYRKKKKVEEMNKKDVVHLLDFLFLSILTFHVD